MANDTRTPARRGGVGPKLLGRALVATALAASTLGIVLASSSQAIPTCDEPIPPPSCQEPTTTRSTTPGSTGVYRIPFADGTRVRVSRDHLSHTPPDRIDLSGTGSTGPYRIVAAASGTVMFIVDNHTAHGGSCADNNYVWIRHATGEWTKYSHMATGSTRGAAGLRVGDTVAAGRFLGHEDDIGCASGDHLHFEVAVPDDPANPIQPSGGYIIGRNRVPTICGIANRRFAAGTTYTAADCTPPPTQTSRRNGPTTHVP